MFITGRVIFVMLATVERYLDTRGERLNDQLGLHQLAFEGLPLQLNRYTWYEYCSNELSSNYLLPNDIASSAIRTN
jgi:hypothetical protein